MRSELTISVARDTDGMPLTGISVTVFNRADNTPAVLYESATGDPLDSNTVVTDRGNATAWLETGSYKAEISHSSIEDYVEYFEAVAGDDVKTILAGVTASEQNLYVAPDPPVDPPPTYMWVETGLGTGDDFTIWIEDGTP